MEKGKTGEGLGEMVVKFWDFGTATGGGTAISSRAHPKVGVCIEMSEFLPEFGMQKAEEKDTAPRGNTSHCKCPVTELNMWL